MNLLMENTVVKANAFLFVLLTFVLSTNCLSASGEEIHENRILLKAVSISPDAESKIRNSLEIEQNESLNINIESVEIELPFINWILGDTYTLYSDLSFDEKSEPFPVKFLFFENGTMFRLESLGRQEVSPEKTVKEVEEEMEKMKSYFSLLTLMPENYNFLSAWENLSRETKISDADEFDITFVKWRTFCHFPCSEDHMYILVNLYKSDGLDDEMYICCLDGTVVVKDYKIRCAP